MNVIVWTPAGFGGPIDWSDGSERAVRRYEGDDGSRRVAVTVPAALVNEAAAGLARELCAWIGPGETIRVTPYVLDAAGGSCVVAVAS